MYTRDIQSKVLEESKVQWFIYILLLGRLSQRVALHARNHWIVVASEIFSDSGDTVRIHTLMFIHVHITLSYKGTPEHTNVVPRMLSDHSNKMSEIPRLGVFHYNRCHRSHCHARSHWSWWPVVSRL